MAKRKTSDLTEVAPIEAANYQNALGHLNSTALLIGDIEALYLELTPLVRLPNKPATALEFVTVACNQLMMTKMLFLKSVLSILRRYQADALTHLRRAIETCSFTFRMSKQNELCKVWLNAGNDDEGKSYERYRHAFRASIVYPERGHREYNPLLEQLKKRLDIASKLVHASVFGSANHFRSVPQGADTQTTSNVNFFDLHNDQFVKTFFMIITTHLLILDLYGQMLRPYLTDHPKWKTDYDTIKERVGRHIEQWRGR